MASRSALCALFATRPLNEAADAPEIDTADLLVIVLQHALLEPNATAATVPRVDEFMRGLYAIERGFSMRAWRKDQPGSDYAMLARAAEPVCAVYWMLLWRANEPGYTAAALVPAANGSHHAQLRLMCAVLGPTAEQGVRSMWPFHTMELVAPARCHLRESRSTTGDWDLKIKADYDKLWYTQQQEGADAPPVQRIIHMLQAMYINHFVINQAMTSKEDNPRLITFGRDPAIDVRLIKSHTVRKKAFAAPPLDHNTSMSEPRFRKHAWMLRMVMDRELFRAACAADPKYLKYADDSLKDDVPFVRELMRMPDEPAPGVHNTLTKSAREQPSFGLSDDATKKVPWTQAGMVLDAALRTNRMGARPLWDSDTFAISTLLEWPHDRKVVSCFESIGKLRNADFLLKVCRKAYKRNIDAAIIVQCSSAHQDLAYLNQAGCLHLLAYCPQALANKHLHNRYETFVQRGKPDHVEQIFDAFRCCPRCLQYMTGSMLAKGAWLMRELLNQDALGRLLSNRSYGCSKPPEDPSCRFPLLFYLKDEQMTIANDILSQGAKRGGVDAFLAEQVRGADRAVYYQAYAAIALADVDSDTLACCSELNVRNLGLIHLLASDAITGRQYEHDKSQPLTVHWNRALYSPRLISRAIKARALMSAELDDLALGYMTGVDEQDEHMPYVLVEILSAAHDDAKTGPCAGVAYSRRLAVCRRLCNWIEAHRMVTPAHSKFVSFVQEDLGCDHHEQYKV